MIKPSVVTMRTQFSFSNIDEDASDMESLAYKKVADLFKFKSKTKSLNAWLIQLALDEVKRNLSAYGLSDDGANASSDLEGSKKPVTQSVAVLKEDDLQASQSRTKVEKKVHPVVSKPEAATEVKEVAAPLDGHKEEAYLEGSVTIDNAKEGVVDDLEDYAPLTISGRPSSADKEGQKAPNLAGMLGISIL